MRRWWLCIPFLLFGACAAVAVPNFLTAMQRSHQKKTMADMRTLATALEAYMGDHPDWKPAHYEGSPVRLASLLQPKYAKQLPLSDGWNHPFGVSLEAKQSGSEATVDYTIWSLGKDGKRDAKWGGAIQHFDNDLVYANGTFTQYPEGT